MSSDANARAMVSMLLVLLGGFMAVMGVAVLLRRSRGGAPLFLEQERHDPPWGLAAMVGALVLHIGLVDVLTQAFMTVPGPGAAVSHKLLAHTIASVATLSLILTMLRARPIDFGVTAIGWPLNAFRGASACALALPVVYGIQILVVQIWEARTHPVETAIASDPTGLTALIAAVGAVIVAPVVEEVVFRGIVLGTLWKVMSPRGRELDLAANVAASLLFAGMHFGQWPAPIPLFALSLGLGEVYRRSGSLVAPIVMHACFNGLSTATLLIDAAFRG